MQFTVTGRYIGFNAKPQHLYLTWDDWNDFSYRTLYGLVYVDENKTRHDIGGVRIAHQGMGINKHPIEKNQTFTRLKPTFFSLGIEDEYYENLNKLSIEIRDFILDALNDIAKNPKYYDLAIVEDVTNVALMRNLTSKTITGQFRRMCNGGARLTPYNFTFKSSLNSLPTILKLSFIVTPDSMPPNNIHVLIGKNGVGKTHVVKQMISTLVDKKANGEHGHFIDDEDEVDFKLFSNLVFVTFSAFDQNHPLNEQKDKRKGMLYHYIGLKQNGTTIGNPKTNEDLENEFLDSLNACKMQPYKERWKNAITMLESDSNFKDVDIKSLIEIEAKSPEFAKKGKKIFNQLSSGHKIVLLTITRVIETLQEKTLVIIDEPEAHLHPPLLATFTRTLSKLLTITNGVSIIATHSPVVLQEVPKSCVWKLRRSGLQSKAERLQIESFGENVGRLTTEVFGLEVITSGYYTLLSEFVNEGKNYDEVLKLFNGNLGMEAKAVLMGLVTERDNSL